MTTLQRSILLCATLVTAFTSGPAEAALKVVFEKPAYKVGDSVTVMVTGVNAVGIQNDLKGTSYEEKNLNGSKRLALGKIAQPGFYAFAFYSGPVRQQFMIFVPAKGTGAQLQTPLTTTFATPADASHIPLLRKFYSNLNKQRLQQGWDAWNGKQFMIENAAKITTVGVFGAVCVSGTVVACGVAVDQTKDLLLDASVDLLIEAAKAMRKANELTEAELAAISKYLRTGKSFLGAIGVSGKVEFGFELGDALLDHDLVQGDAKLVIKLFKDSTEKYYLLYKKLK